MKKAEIFLVGQTPPPHHGQSIVTAMLFDHDWPNQQVVKLRMNYSASIDDVGQASLKKIGHLFKLILSTWAVLIKRRPRILYYLPASANRVPVVRDVIYLGMVRFFFPKTVFHFHAGGLPDFLNESGLLGRIAKLVYANADVSIDVIETNPATGKYFGSKKNIVVKNGVDVDLVKRNRINDGVFRVLFVGVLNEGKGVKELIQTAVLMRKKRCRCEFILVGDWVSLAFKHEVEELISDNGIADMVRFTGPLKGSEKWQAYADADCFFFPSHYEAETFGLVLVEAMAFGLPLVTTRWRGIPLVVKGGDCAFLRDVKSPKQYAQALMEIESNATLRSNMGKRAQSHYVSNYTKTCFLKKMEKVFEEMLAGSQVDKN